MKNKRLIIVGVLTALAVAYTVSVIPDVRRQAERERTIAALQRLSHDRVQAAVQDFARDRKLTDGTVTLRELIQGGYLRSDDVRGLEDRDVTVSVTADDTTPAMVWIRVRSTDGSDIALMADGSVQGLIPDGQKAGLKNDH